jgi:hypothetical protein
LESRSKAVYRTRLILLLAQAVFTLREALTLARTRFAQILFRPRSISKQKRPELSRTGPDDRPTSANTDLSKDEPERELTPDLVAKYKDEMTRHH